MSTNDFNESNVLQLSKAAAELAMAVVKKSERGLVQERRELIDIRCKMRITNMAGSRTEEWDNDPVVNAAVKSFKEQLAKSNILAIDSGLETMSVGSIVDNLAQPEGEK